jgi:hypothetical protein
MAGRCQHLITGHEQELGLRVDEPLDQPRTSDAVDVGVLSRDPLHGLSFGDPSRSKYPPVTSWVLLRAPIHHELEQDPVMSADLLSLRPP